MKIIILMSLVLLGQNLFGRTNRFPISPDLTLTPGALCTTPSEYRYPERIPYCEREVNGWMKELVFISYKKIGFSLSGEREQYKVDHYIPLCLGGSNDITNLWPQYFTVYEKTDELEPLACEVLAKGKISQHDAIALVMAAKLDHSKIPETMKYLRRLKK